MEFVEADYEDGVLRPRAPLHLRAGERVGVLVVRRPDPRRWDMARLAATASEDALLAEEGLDHWAADLDRQDRR